MKRLLLKRFLSLTMVLAMAAGSTAYAGQERSQAHSARDAQAAVVIDPVREYMVTFASGKTVRVSGADLVINHDTVGVRTEDATEMRMYPRAEVRELRVRRGTWWGIGGAIGLGIGGITGAATGAATMNTSCPSGSTDCSTNNFTWPLIWGAVGGLVGAGLGAGIGAAFTRTGDNIMVAPQVSLREGATAAGLSISGNF